MSPRAVYTLPLLLLLTLATALFILGPFILFIPVLSASFVLYTQCQRGQSRKLLHPPAPSSSPTHPYPTNLFPNARSITTPHGPLQVYEFGRETGRKVLLVHGDGTPSPIFYTLAHSLAEQGFRVLLFDQYGRGYSSALSPFRVRYDGRLFAQQVLYALASSSIAWTGRENRFVMIGYSIGGAYAMEFASTMNYMLEGVVLIAPAGLLRGYPGPYGNWPIWWPGVATRGMTRRSVAACLGLDAGKTLKLNAEGDGDHENSRSGQVSWRERRVDDRAIRQWSLDYHPAFADVVGATVRDAPAVGQFETWQKVCNNLGQSKLEMAMGLLILLGEDDPVVVSKEFEEDLRPMLRLAGAEDCVAIEYFEGGHDFMLQQTEGVVKSITGFVRLKSRIPALAFLANRYVSPQIYLEMDGLREEREARDQSNVLIELR